MLCSLLTLWVSADSPFLQGNVILTDHKYEILTLLRSHRDDAKDVAIMARHVYPLQTIRLRARATDEALDAALAHADAKRGLKGQQRNAILITLAAFLLCHPHTRSYNLERGHMANWHMKRHIPLP